MLHISSEADSFLEGWTCLFSHFWVTQAWANVTWEICQDLLFVCSDLIQDDLNLNLQSCHTHILSEKNILCFEIKLVEVYTPLSVYLECGYEEIYANPGKSFVFPDPPHMLYLKKCSPQPQHPPKPSVLLEDTTPVCLYCQRIIKILFYEKSEK